MKYLILLAAITISSCNYMNTQTIKCAKIIGKERIHQSEGGGYYLIYTDKGEFTITDEFFRGNFESSSWYGSLEVDESYSFKTGSYRIGILSMYPNIHSKPTDCLTDKLNETEQQEVFIPTAEQIEKARNSIK